MGAAAPKDRKKLPGTFSWEAYLCGVLEFKGALKQA